MIITTNEKTVTVTHDDTGVYFDTVYYDATDPEDDEIISLSLYKGKTFSFNVTKDGAYRIMHWDFSNHSWTDLPTTKAEGTTYYYYILDDDDVPTIYKYVDGTNDVALTISDLTKIKPGVSNNILTTEVEDAYTFSILNLHACYVKLSQEILKYCYNECDDEEYNINSARGKRDFVWSAINVIQYYVAFSQFAQAQLLIERLNKCGSLCSNTTSNGTNDCGCH